MLAIKGQRYHGRGETAYIALPPDDRSTHPQFIDTQQHCEDHLRYRIKPPGRGTKYSPHQSYADQEVANPKHDAI